MYTVALFLVESNKFVNSYFSFTILLSLTSKEIMSVVSTSSNVSAKTYLIIVDEYNTSNFVKLESILDFSFNDKTLSPKTSALNESSSKESISKTLIESITPAISSCL